MILSGKEIEKKMGTDILITPYNPKQLNPNSYNLRLHNELLVYDEEVLDMKRPLKTRTLTIPEDGLVLQPGTLYLGRTVEVTRTQGCVSMIDGRSSVGRLGIFVHVTAGVGNVGSEGYWTLEITCIHPVRVYPFVQICQLYFLELKGEYTPYTSNKYHNNNGIQPSLMYKDFEQQG